MKDTDLTYSFIQEWLKKTKNNKDFNQSIVNAIEESLGGLMQEELDETNLLELLKEINYGDRE